jgi:hypothetical protein
MLREELKQMDRSRLWRASAAIGLCLGLAVPAWGQDEAPEEESAPLQAAAVPDANDQVVILSNGVPTTELRIREPGVRTHENLHGIGERTDPASIPTLGPGSQAVETRGAGWHPHAERCRHARGPADHDARDREPSPGLAHPLPRRLPLV